MPTPAPTLETPETDLTNRLRRFSVDEYHHMIAAGVFGDDERFELLEGHIVAKTVRYPPHDVALNKTADALRDAAPKRWRVRVQSAITTADSEPEPDVSVVQGPHERYRDRHPGGDEIALVVEVADSSLKLDRSLMKRIYARARIREYWIVNIPESCVERYTDPTGPGRRPDYRDRRIVRRGEFLALMISGKSVGEIPVESLLP